MRRSKRVSKVPPFATNEGPDYEERVQAYENQGMTRSDAQAAVDAEDLKASRQLTTTQAPKSFEVIPATQSLAVPIKFITAALLTSAKGDVRYYLNGVYLHAVDGELRVAGTDGHRMIVSRYVLPEGEKLPGWATAGIILPREELAQALPVLIKNGTVNDRPNPEPSLTIEHKPGDLNVTLRAHNGFASFTLRVIDGKFPDYARIMESTGEQLARGEGEVLEAAAINTAYLKGAADVAKKLGAKAVHSFVGKADQAVVFTFQGAPDTVLIVMPMRGGPAVSDGAIKLLGAGSVTASIAALRAHVTRATKLLTTTTDEDNTQAKETEEKIKSWNARIDSLLAMSANKQIGHEVSS